MVGSHAQSPVVEENGVGCNELIKRREHGECVTKRLENHVEVHVVDVDGLRGWSWGVDGPQLLHQVLHNHVNSVAKHLLVVVFCNHKGKV